MPMRRDVANLAGPAGRDRGRPAAADFRFRACLALAPLLVWGARALTGRTLRYAMWRLVAWPLGTLTVAAGLGVFPAPAICRPARAAGSASPRAAFPFSAQVSARPGLTLVLPLFLLAAGLPLAFLATGLRFMPILRGMINFPAARDCGRSD